MDKQDKPEMVQSVVARGRTVMGQKDGARHLFKPGEIVGLTKAETAILARQGFLHAPATQTASEAPGDAKAPVLAQPETRTEGKGPTVNGRDGGMLKPGER